MTDLTTSTSEKAHDATVPRATGATGATADVPGSGLPEADVRARDLTRHITPRHNLRWLLWNLTNRRFTGWLLVALIVATWELSSKVSYNPTISSPSVIAQTWWWEVNHGTLLKELVTTLRTMALGFAVAFPVGVAVGFVMGRVRVIWALLEPTVEILRLTPQTAILPIFILFLGLGDSMKIAIYLTTIVFPMIMTSYAGARSVSKVLSETAATYRLSWWATQREIALPAAVPYVLVGVRQALGSALVIAVVVGMLAGNDGIGYYILFQQQAFNIPALLAGVITTAFIGYVINAAFLLQERRFTRWRRTDRDSW